MRSNKQRVFQKLTKTYCRIGRSSIAGVGVVAICEIPSGVNPFEGVPDHEGYEFSKKELSDLPSEVFTMVEDFFPVNENGNYIIPECGLNGLDISFFLNHSDTPNLETEDGTYFKTSRVILKGEELTVSYKGFDNRFKNKTSLNF